MPVQLRVVSWNIQKKTTNATYIAELMRVHQIDICALLEVPNGTAGMLLGSIVAALNNLSVPYHHNDWQWHAVNVGDEAVGYIWHQNMAVGPNAFQVELKANGGQRLGGAVTRNATNARIYFPTTQFNWASLPGTPSGRRPAYLSFVTNDGAAARRFTVLDLHTPFADSSIQSYSTSLYATSREITLVDRTDVGAAAVAAAAGLSATLAAAVTLLLSGLDYITSAKLAEYSVQGASKAIDGDEVNLATVLRDAAYRSVTDGLNAFDWPREIDDEVGKRIARASAIAGFGAAATMVASVQLPVAPPGATADAGAARATAIANVTAVVGQFHTPAKRGSAVVKNAIIQEALRMVDAAIALGPFAFNALQLTAVDVSIVAGDFNVDYSDTTGYSSAQKKQLGRDGDDNNAYTRLLALGGARNNERTTRIGPSAYEKQRVYTLKLRCPLQSNDAMLSDYVPLSMASLRGTVVNYVGYDSWLGGLQTLARNQSLAWATILNNVDYSSRLENAFDREVINNSLYFRANCYDNIFVRGGAVAASGTIDVMSELGSWGALAAALPNPQPAMAPNPWAAAAAGLNALARAELGTLGTPPTFTYGQSSYTLTAALADAEDAAVFFDQRISDHLPVFVQVTL